MDVRQPTRQRGDLSTWWVAAVVCAVILWSAFILQPAVGGENTNPKSASPAAPLLGEPLAERLWQVLADHQQGRPEQAAEKWAAIRLPDDVRHWKQIGLAAARLESDQLPSAHAALCDAKTADKDAAVVNYYLGLLRLQQAAKAEQWPDAVGKPKMILASHQPLTVAPNTKGMYRLAAAQEFEQAIETAAEVNLDRWLAPAPVTSEGVFPPTARDLVIALGADQFEAYSHHFLATFNLEDGDLDRAELHLNRVIELGADASFGFRELGRQYEDVGRNWDAACAYAKVVGQDQEDADSAWKTIRNLRKALLNN
ncbi:MAG: hypothetical protein N2C14_29915 [Planctomycetales bacterium]